MIRSLESMDDQDLSSRKIRDAQGSWKPMETYISEHAAAKFSHGYCPECGTRALGELRDKNTTR